MLGGLIATMFTGAVSADITFGTLTNGAGQEIAFNAGEGNSNTNFIYQNYPSGSTKSLNYTMGLSAQTYYGGGNGPLTNNGVDTFYAQAGADQSGNPMAVPGSGRWAFKWSVTASDGAGVNSVPENLVMALRIDGPSGGNWGSLDSSFAQSVVDYPGMVNTVANQQVWTVGYDFMQLDSGTLTGGTAPGVWDGMNYDFNEVGAYFFQIKVWDTSSGGLDEIGTLGMNVEVVPGVGGLAVLSGLGLAGRRRRR
jgi:hypothetical protein